MRRISKNSKSGYPESVVKVTGAAGLTTEEVYVLLAHALKDIMQNGHRELLFYQGTSFDIDSALIHERSDEGFVRSRRFRPLYDCRSFMIATFLFFSVILTVSPIILHVVHGMTWPLFLQEYQRNRFDILLSHRVNDHRAHKNPRWVVIPMMVHEYALLR